MDIVSLIGSTTTVVSFVAFVGVVVWAYSGRRKRAFDDAANAPFALDGLLFSSMRSPTRQFLSYFRRSGFGSSAFSGTIRGPSRSRQHTCASCFGVIFPWVSELSSALPWQGPVR